MKFLEFKELQFISRYAEANGEDPRIHLQEEVVVVITQNDGILELVSSDWAAEQELDSVYQELHNGTTSSYVLVKASK